MIKNPLITVAIVNYKTPQLTTKALQSIFDNLSINLTIKVVIADNCSGDDSFLFITEYIQKRNWQNWVAVIQLPRNGGFSYGNNKIIEQALANEKKPDYIWLLNPDTIVMPGAIEPLVHHLQTNPAAGIVGCRLEGTDGTVQVAAFRDHSIVSELLTSMQLGVLDSLFSKWVVAPTPTMTINKWVSVDWLSGASIMIRREVFDQIGLLDEGFFMYYEDTDFCRRARKSDWRCDHVPESRVVHLVGAATGTNLVNTKQARRPQYWFDSRRRYFLKNHGWLTLMCADFVFIIGFCSWKIRKIIQKKQDKDPPHFLMDFIKNSFLYKGFWF